jgi:hypothetical protein
MPDLQSPVPDPATPVPVVVEVLAALDDAEYAFGCECAYPSLQIAQWSQEARGGEGA